jgi:hypothetical protein
MAAILPPQTYKLALYILSRLWLAREAAQCHLPGHAISDRQERNWQMRDELDGRMWVDHHEQFGHWIDGAIDGARGGFARLALWDGTTHQLFALIAAFAITGLTFNATA